MKLKNIVGNVSVALDTARIENNMKRAQRLLNMQVVADCDPYVPFQQGALRNSVRYPDGIYGGVIEYATPYAHYQYMGELYLAENGSSWAHRGEAKHPSGKELTQHFAGTTEQWFEEAKQVHGEQWLELVRREAGKG